MTLLLAGGVVAGGRGAGCGDWGGEIRVSRWRGKCGVNLVRVAIVDEEFAVGDDRGGDLDELNGGRGIEESTE
jgi:hypothetical protein